MTCSMCGDLIPGSNMVAGDKRPFCRCGIVLKDPYYIGDTLIYKDDSENSIQKELEKLNLRLTELENILKTWNNA